MKLLIDGDACPVKEEAIAVAGQAGLSVLVVASYNHVSHREYPDYVQVHYVERGSDAADYRIVALVEPGDVVITQDYGLATLVMNKATVLHHMGWVYRPEQMDQLLAQRYLGQVSRRKHGRYAGKGPKPFGPEDRVRFRECLIQLIQTTKKRDEA